MEGLGMVQANVISGEPTTTLQDADTNSRVQQIHRVVRQLPLTVAVFGPLGIRR
jgi:hypothetical protein